MEVASSQTYGPVAFQGRFSKVCTLPSISSHSRLTWLLEMPVIPIACTN